MSLAEILAARLALMADVARYKWNNGLAITDATREATVLRNTVATAKAAGLSEAYATRVVSEQIRAAKMIQTALFEQWQASGQAAFTAVPDLNHDLRPAIGTLTRTLLDALAVAEPALEQCQLPVQLRGVPELMHTFPEAWRIAVAGLLPAHCVH